MANTVPMWPRVKVTTEPVEGYEDSWTMMRVRLSTLAPDGSARKFGCIQTYSGVGKDTKDSAIDRASEELNRRMGIEFPDPDKLTTEEINTCIALCRQSNGVMFSQIIRKLEVMRHKA